jgi:aspartokinase-like uncharacterized kinase
MTNRAPKIRVIKVGGSLLEWPNLPCSLRDWLADQPGAVSVLVCGGGPFVDAVREASAVHSLSDETAHWLAIDCLAITARLLGLCCGYELIREYGNLREFVRQRAASTVVFDPQEFLIAAEPRVAGLALPHDWTATSDSIASRLAAALQADELILLKSSEPPAGTWPQLAAAGYIDSFFPTAAAALPNVRIVNLRVPPRPPQ